MPSIVRFVVFGPNAIRAKLALEIRFIPQVSPRPRIPSISKLRCLSHGTLARCRRHALQQEPVDRGGSLRGAIRWGDRQDVAPIVAEPQPAAGRRAGQHLQRLLQRFAWIDLERLLAERLRAAELLEAVLTMEIELHVDHREGLAVPGGGRYRVTRI